MTTRADIVAGLAALATDLDNDPRIPVPSHVDTLGLTVYWPAVNATLVYAAAETQHAPVTQTRDANGALHTTTMLRYGGAVTVQVYCLEAAPAGWAMEAPLEDTSWLQMESVRKDKPEPGSFTEQLIR